MRLFLYIPTLGELGYRQKLMSDPATMSYNKGYSLAFPGYGCETGCIAFPRQEWADWYNAFIGREPERYYAYIVHKASGGFIGEVNLHRSNSPPGTIWAL